jgi:hypothetical protein
MNKLVDEYYNIRVGDTVWATQIFDWECEGKDFGLDTREGVVESIDVDLDRSLFGVCFNIRYPSEMMHGADIDQMRPDACLLVVDDEYL